MTSPTLTKRQLQVLTGMAHGKTSREIASDLGLSYRTIRNLTQEIFETLDVHNRTQAAVLAIQTDLVEGPLR